MKLQPRSTTPRPELEAEQAAKRARPEEAEDSTDAGEVFACGASDSGEKEGDSDNDDADGGAGGGSGAEDDKKLNPLQYGANIPTGPTGRLSKLKVYGVWLHIKRLKATSSGGESPGKTKPFTYVCLLCWDLLTLTQDKALYDRFLTTIALTHKRKFHSEIDSDSG